MVGTSSATDLAVQGKGYFVVSDSSGSTFLTRNGSFIPDASGDLVNNAGFHLMAFNVQKGPATPSANWLSGLEKVNVTGAGHAAVPTTSGACAANLPATATVVASSDLPSTNSANAAYTQMTSLQTFDNLGGAHAINIYFT
ncbi:flagellar hook-basal body complex protein, partial [Staphylococcus pseudintermedius]|uniref:flagellar hook-basal body complex protein n=1 Tax=Staphylococcus pseudintermedius TaxID=283734 RepID=UPI001642C5C9